MKTSIFDMALTLPPLVEITQVKKDMPMGISFLIVDCLFE